MATLRLSLGVLLVVSACGGEAATPPPSPSTAPAPEGAPAEAAPAAPVEPPPPAVDPSEIIDLTAGESHVCAVRREGTVVCWGGNEHWELGEPRPETGDARPDFDHTPFAPPLTGITRVVAYGRETCAYDDAGHARCWGDDRTHVLEYEGVAPGATYARFDDAHFHAGPTGDVVSEPNLAGYGDAEEHADFVRSALHGATEVASCGEVILWLGADGVFHGWSRGVEAWEIASGVRDFAVDGVHYDDCRQVCAARTDGTVHCGGTEELEAIEGVANAVEVGVGRGFGCARTSAGAVSCWGVNDAGQLGRGSVAHRTREPAGPVVGLTGADELVVGGEHACVRREGHVECWGHIPTAAFRHGDTTRMWDDDRPRSWIRDTTRALHAPAPVQVPGLEGATDVVATRDNTCVLLGDGHVRCWGASLYGANGDGTTANRATPTEVPGIADAAEIAASWGTVCVRRADGTVSCWGARPDDPHTAVPTPTAIDGVAGATALRSSLAFFCATGEADAVTCFGRTPFLGPAAGAGVTRPDLGALLGGGSNISFVRNDDGSIDEVLSSQRRTSPPLTGVVSVASGHDHSCAISADAHVLCWGHDDRGQLGLGEEGNSDEIRPVENLEGATDVVNGDGFGCALHGGGVTCWGDNSYGQLGRSIRRDRRPTAVNVSSPLTTHVVALAAGSNHVCAVRRDGTVWCWGDATHGSLGDGRASYRTEPTRVDLTIPPPPAPEGAPEGAPSE